MATIVACIESGEFKIVNHKIIHTSANMQLSASVDYIGDINTIQRIAHSAVDTYLKSGESSCLVACSIGFIEVFELIQNDLNLLFPSRCTIVQKRSNGLKVKRE